jgi:hypothetical protein
MQGYENAGVLVDAGVASGDVADNHHTRSVDHIDPDCRGCSVAARSRPRRLHQVVSQQG